MRLAAGDLIAIKPAALLALATVLLTSCGPPPPEDRFSAWLATPGGAGVAEYRQYLVRQKLGDVVPMHALLRTARRWKECNASEFALPPRPQWPNILPTLRALKALQGAGLVDGTRIASGYRDHALNGCAGGSLRSRHVSNNALDFDLAKSPHSQAPQNVLRLCEYWRSEGPALNLGLGFYTDTKTHLDTSGFRTWGNDHTRRTSLCQRKPARL